MCVLSFVLCDKNDVSNKTFFGVFFHLFLFLLLFVFVHNKDQKKEARRVFLRNETLNIYLYKKERERERKKKRGEKVFEREKKNDTLLETQKFKKIARQKKTNNNNKEDKEDNMVKVRLHSPSELKKIEEFLADAATDKALEAKATYTDQIQQNMMSFQLIRMCESVTETLSKNVLVAGREPRAEEEEEDDDGKEEEMEEVRRKEEKRLKELMCDPELDELENEVAELTEKVGEQRLTGPARVLQNLENRMKEERAEIEAKKNKNEEELEKDEEKDEENNKNILAAANISEQELEETKKKLEKSLAAMPLVKERLQKALEKLARLTNEIDNQRTRAPPGTIERAIDAAPVLGFDDDATTEEATALRAKNETRRRLARELMPLGRC